MVTFENVTKIYEPDVAALQDVSFQIDKGEFVFIVGASGSGKSTVIRLVLKEIEPTRGRIVVGGRELGIPYAPSAARWRRNAWMSSSSSPSSTACAFPIFMLVRWSFTIV